MSKDRKRLTSVSVVEKNLKEFKVVCLQDGITLQLLVNKAIELYLNDDSFKKLIKKED